MHRATDVRTLPKTPVLVNNYGFVKQGSLIAASMPRFDSATFWAPQGGTYRAPPPSSYQGLYRPTRLLAVLSSVQQRPPGRAQSQTVKISVTSSYGVSLGVALILAGSDLGNEGFSIATAAVGDLDLVQGPVGIEEDEQVGRAVAAILAVVALELAWPGCGFRRKSARHSDLKSATDSDLKPATCFDPSRPPIPI